MQTARWVEQKMQIAVCDDNSLFLQELKMQLSTIPIVKTVFDFSNLDNFVLSIDEGKKYDAVLMDIDWDKDGMGMDIAEEIYKLSPKTKVIYVTGFWEYSQHVFLRRTNLSGFLTKPVSTKLLEENLRKIAEEISLIEQPSIVLRQRRTSVSVPLREIYFIESRAHTVEVHTAGETVVSYERLGNILRSLPVHFYQCHKSYVINMQQIKRFQENKIILKNGEIIPVSRSKFNETKEAYFRYMGQSF